MKELYDSAMRDGKELTDLLEMEMTVVLGFMLHHQKVKILVKEQYRIHFLTFLLLLARYLEIFLNPSDYHNSQM